MNHHFAYHCRPIYLSSLYSAYVKALEAATKAGEWTKASDILASMEVGGAVSGATAAAAVPFRLELAHHYIRMKQYSQAEAAFVAAGEPKLAIEMYNEAGMWEEAHALATTIMQQDDLTE